MSKVWTFLTGLFLTPDRTRLSQANTSAMATFGVGLAAIWGVTVPPEYLKTAALIGTVSTALGIRKAQQ